MIFAIIWKKSLDVKKAFQQPPLNSVAGTAISIPDFTRPVFKSVKGIQPIGFGAIAATASRLGSGRMVRKKAHRLYRMKEYTTKNT